MSKMKNYSRVVPQSQRGAVLVVTIFVLMALTVVALAVTNTSQSQAIMVRNNQFRLESFNSSYAEIDAQIDFINKRKISDGVPQYIIRLIDGNVGDRVHDEAGVGTPDYLEKRSSVAATYIDTDVATIYRGTCMVFGQQLGAGEEKVACNELKVESDAQLMNTNIASNQHQVYEYKTLKQ
jgi:hypothetical protein